MVVGGDIALADVSSAWLNICTTRGGTMAALLRNIDVVFLPICLVDLPELKVLPYLLGTTPTSIFRYHFLGTRIFLLGTPTPSPGYFNLKPLSRVLQPPLKGTPTPLSQVL